MLDVRSIHLLAKIRYSISNCYNKIGALPQFLARFSREAHFLL